MSDGVLTPIVTGARVLSRSRYLFVLTSPPAVTSAIEGIGLSVWRFNGSPGTISLDNGLPGTPANFGRTCTLSAAVIGALIDHAALGRGVACAIACFVC